MLKVTQPGGGGGRTQTQVSLSWKTAGAGSKCQGRCPLADRGLDASGLSHLTPTPPRPPTADRGSCCPSWSWQAVAHTLLKSVDPCRDDQWPRKDRRFTGFNLMATYTIPHTAREYKGCLAPGQLMGSSSEVCPPHPPPRAPPCSPRTRGLRVGGLGEGVAEATAAKMDEAH